MNMKIVRTLVRKEMLDVLRDKKTVVMMIVVPLILYPLIFIGAMQVMVAVSSGMEQQSYRIAVEAGDSGALRQRLEKKQAQDKDNDADRDREDKVDKGITGTGQEKDGESAEDAGKQEAGVSFQLMDAGSIRDYQAVLQEGEIDAYVAASTKGGQMQYHIYYLSSDSNSSYVFELLKDELEGLKADRSRQRVSQAGLDVDDILEPVIYEGEDIASSEQSLGSILGSILPFMLIISLLMGTMYPAIDTTAGERERGTLETMLTLPVTNHQLIAGKFLAVAAIGMVSALLNMLSMGGIAFYIYQVMGIESETGSFGSGSFDVGLFLPAVCVSILAVFAFSLFISAITMCVTSFAKSYKEANNYITPLMLVVMLTGYIGFIPNIELTQVMAAVPVANICLLVKNLLLFQIDQGVVAIVLISNIAYAVLAVLFLSKIYDSEAILFGDSKGNFQIFEKRGNLKKGGVPAVSDACLVLAVTAVLMLYVGSILQIKYGIGGLFGTQLIILAVPLSVVLYTKKDLRLSYGFQKSPLSGYLGGAAMATGLFLVNIVLSYWLCMLFPESAGRVSNAFSEIMDGGMAVNLSVIALTPAICEEMLFRGVVFHSLRARYRAVAAMGITAAVFGAYHMSLVKFIPTGLLGLALCYVVHCSGSIFPAILMHFLNNALSVVISAYPEQAGNVFPILLSGTPSVSDVLIFGGMGVMLAGIGLVVLERLRQGTGKALRK